MAQRPIGRP